MACKLQTLAGGDFACDVSMGGVKKIWIANYDDVTGITYAIESGTTYVTAETSAATVISAVTMASGGKFYPYSFKRNTANFNSTLNVSPENGVNYISTEIAMQFSRMDTAKRLEIKALSLNDLCVIVEDMNGYKWFFGITSPVSASAGGATTGTNMSDGNNYTITLLANELQWAYPYVGDIPTE